MKNIAILGSTGSIGKNTVDIALKHPEEFKVVALSAHSNVELLAEQVRALKPELVSISTEVLRKELLSQLDEMKAPEVMVGQEGLDAVAAWSSSDILMISVVGSRGLLPLLKAIEAGKDIAFVNKEAMVMAGQIVMEAVDKYGVNLIPVDSEHSAIFQCLTGESAGDLEKVILTSSGGPFRQSSLEEMRAVNVAEAIAHPRWSMGPKISVDSATLMNKGLEIIEARWLFDLDLDQIEVMIHPQSIVHSMVEFVDGSVKAQLGVSDMRPAIQYALTYPGRMDLPIEKLNLIELGQLNFEAPDETRFEALKIAKQAARQGGSYPAVVNAANEVAVEAFLAEEIGFLDIAGTVKKVLDRHEGVENFSLEEIVAIDQEARLMAREVVKEKELCLH